MELSKTHSKNDLMELINTLELKVVFSHADNKKSIQDKLLELLQNKELQKDFKVNNVYKIKSYKDLKYYLINKNPKKTLTIKEKNDVMKICKNIIHYCNNGHLVELSNYYNDTQQIHDDMLYIIQFGDIPSVRRCCKLMNKFKKQDEHYIPLISPQVQKRINDKMNTKTTILNKLVIKREPVTISFS